MRLKSAGLGVAIALSAGLAACAGKRDGYTTVGVGTAYYDGYYDDYYGPFYDGYWGNDGYFYYSDRDRRVWHRDDGRHFRRDNTPGHHYVRGTGHRRDH